LVSSCCTYGELAASLELISSLKPSKIDGFEYGDASKVGIGRIHPSHCSTGKLLEFQYISRLANQYLGAGTGMSTAELTGC